MSIELSFYLWVLAVTLPMLCAFLIGVSIFRFAASRRPRWGAQKPRGEFVHLSSGAGEATRAGWFDA